MSIRKMAAAFALSLLASCGVVYNPQNYEITVSLKTPHGIARGSGVLSVMTRAHTGIGGSTVYSIVHGEAIPVSLGDGRVLFMTISRGEGEWRAYAPWVDEKNEKDLDDGALVPIDTDLYPHFLFFGDVRNPRTAIEIRRGQEDKLGKNYGPIVMMIRETDKPITTGIDKMLPWVDAMESGLDGTVKCGNTSYVNLPCATRSNFKRDGKYGL